MQWQAIRGIIIRTGIGINTWQKRIKKQQVLRNKKMSSGSPLYADQQELCIILPENISQAEIQFLSHKCESAVPILKENWDVLLPKCRSFLALVDREKVAFDIGVKELNNILISGFFTADEVKIIKKFRYQVKNNFAARRMRDNHRKVEDKIESEIEVLMSERKALLKEKNNLTVEISFYQNQIEELNSVSI